MNTVDSSWQELHQLGFGYNIVRGDVAARGIEPFVTTTNQTRDEYVYIRSVSDQQEMSQELSVTLQGDYTLDGVKIGASASFVDNVEASSTSLSLIAEFSSTATGYSLAQDGLCSLTPAARSYFETEGLDAFREKYGHYFIAGHRLGAKFFAVYRCSASSQKEFIDFKASLSANAPELFDASGAVEFSRLASEKRISVDIRIHMIGVPNDIPRPPIDKLTPDAVLGVLNWFRDNQTGTPVDSLFMSYSNVLDGYSNRLDVSPDLLTRLRQIYSNYWMLRFVYRSLPNYYRTVNRAVYEQLTNAIEVSHGIFMSDPALIDRYFAESSSMLADFTNIQRREALYFAVMSQVETTPEPPPGQQNSLNSGWVAAFGKTNPDPDLAPFLITSEVHEVGDKAFGFVNSIFDYSTPDRVIMGWSVESRKDNNGNWQKISTEQAVLGNTLRLYMDSEFWRGIDYKVVVTHADRNLFRFGADGMIAAQEREEI